LCIWYQGLRPNTGHNYAQLRYTTVRLYELIRVETYDANDAVLLKHSFYCSEQRITARLKFLERATCPDASSSGFRFDHFHVVIA